MEAVEIISFGDGPILLSCEHASNELHQPWGPDEALQHTHWAWDPGAADVVRALAKRSKSTAVLARFSRLLVDPNRPLDSPTLFRTEAHGVPIQLNQALTDAEKSARVQRFYTPYHNTLSTQAARSTSDFLLSIHSFTPIYEGSTRDVEVGVLFDTEDTLAHKIINMLTETTPFMVRANEPYSGKGGMMYSCFKHATANHLRGIELELRQDLLANTTTRNQLIDAIDAVFSSLTQSA